MVSIMLIKHKIKKYSMPFVVAIFLAIFCYSCNIPAEKKERNVSPEKNKEDSSLNARKEKGMRSLAKNIGEKFMIEKFIDTSGKLVKLDFAKSDITIVDFWFNGCGACIKEMNQFKDLIQGKEKQITIISISISSYLLWKQKFIEKSDRYQFLATSIPNWQHLNLKANTEPIKKDDDINDRIDELVNKLDVSFYPSYFVINKQGIILNRPISAVDYILKSR